MGFLPLSYLRDAPDARGCDAFEPVTAHLQEFIKHSEHSGSESLFP